MDEQRAWLKAKRKQYLRLLAALTGICVLFTSIPQIQSSIYETASAKEQRIYKIEEFAPLSEKVQRQVMPYGTAVEELTLPDTLEAFVCVEEKNAGEGVKEDAPDDSEKADQDPGKDKETGDEGDGTENEDGAGNEGEAGAGNEGEAGAGNEGEAGAGNEGGAGDGNEGGAGDENEGGAGNENEGGAGDGNEGSTGNESGAGDGNEGEAGNENEGGAGDENEGEAGDGNEGEAGNENEGGTGNESEGEAGDGNESEAGNESEGEAGDGNESEAGDGNEGGAADENDNGGMTEDKAGVVDEARAVTTFVNMPVYRSAVPEAEIELLYPKEAADSEDTQAPKTGAPEGAETTGEETASEEETVIVKEAWEEISDVTWESSPAYDGETPGDYRFTAVLSEKYETAEGVSLPVITVTVEEEETFDLGYAVMSINEVAPLAVQQDDSGAWNISSDNAGESYRIRVLWQTTDTVSKYASSSGCRDSWMGLKVPGMSDQKYYFTKDILRDSSTVYVLGEFDLPYTYADSDVIFPANVGIYSGLSEGFQGTMTLQSYHYVTGEWDSYSQCRIGPEGLPGEEHWSDIPAFQNRIAYIDIDMEDLYLGAGDGQTQGSWSMVCMDRFGVVVTDQSKGFGSDWKLVKENGSGYPAGAGLTLSGGREAFEVTAASGTAGLTENPVASVSFSAPGGGSSSFRFPIRIGEPEFVVGKLFINYYDNKGLIYSVKTESAQIHTVVDLTELTLDRDLECPVGKKFAGSYTGSDGKTYLPGDTFFVTSSLSLYPDYAAAGVVIKLDGQVDEDGNRTVLQNEVYEFVVDQNNPGKVKAPIPAYAPPRRYFGGWGVRAEGDWEWKTVYDKEGNLFNKDWKGRDGIVLYAMWCYDVSYRYLPGADGWCYTTGFNYVDAYKGIRWLLKDLVGFTGMPKTEEQVYRHGYDFLGWTLDGEPFTEDSVVLVDKYQYDLRAQWKAKEMQLSLDANGGSFPDGQTTWNRQEKVVYGATLGEVKEEFPVPTRAGWKFEGWGYAADTLLRNKLKDGDLLDQTEDFTLYAVWSRSNITIYLDPDGGTFPEGAAVSVKTDPGAAVELPVPVKPGYVQEGWIEPSGAHVPGSPYRVPADVTASYTIKANWRANTYKIAFDKNNGIGNMEQQNYTYDVPMALPANTFTRGGYRFAGWNTKADGTGVSFGEQEMVSNLTAQSWGTVTLYAQWKAEEWTVSFDPNGGYFTEGKTPSKTVQCQSKYGTLPTPVKERYDFQGWYTTPSGEGIKVTADSEVTGAEQTGGNITLYARWTYGYFTLSFDLRGGAGNADCTFGDMEGKRSTGIVLPKVFPERGASWKFLGWSRTAAASAADAAYEAEKLLKGVTLKPGVKDTEEKITLYAVWHNDNPILEYDANTDEKGVTVPVSQEFADGKTVVFAKKPVWKDHTFSGWALTADGKALYQGGETIYSAVSVKLYAVWKSQEDKIKTDGEVECQYKKDGVWHLTTLKDAMSKVPAGGEIILLKSLEMAETLTISGTKRYTLNLNGFELDWKSAGSVAVTGSGCNITLKNGRLIYPRLTKLQVSGGAALVLDGISLGMIAALGSGTSLTLQGATVVKQEAGSVSTDDGRIPIISIADGASAEIEYAEVTERGVGDSALIEVSNANLTIRDGYFWTLRAQTDTTAKYNPVIGHKGTGRLVLEGGYFRSYTSYNKTECMTWWQSDVSWNQTLIATESGVSGSGYQNGTDVGVKTPVFNWAAGSSDHWFTPGTSTGTESVYWGIYEEPGEEQKKTLTTPALTNADYLSGDTRFKLLQDHAAMNEGEKLTLNQTDRRAVIDLNGGRFAISKADVELSDFVLKNGVLKKESKDSRLGNVTMENGVIESDVVVQIDGMYMGAKPTEITLKNMVLKPGATFYVENRSGLSDQFESQYAFAEWMSEPPMDFGGTILKKMALSVGTYDVFRACIPETNSVTFHANYPKDGDQAETTAKATQTLGGTYVFPESKQPDKVFSAPAGFTFDHWNTKADGSGSIVLAGSVYGDTAVGDVYAIWRRNHYTVTYDRNGGDWQDPDSLGVEASQTSVTRTAAYDSKAGPFPTVTRQGWVLDGWYTASTGGTKVTADTAVKGKVTYYAHWSKAGDTKYTVIHEGTTLAGKTVTLDKQERFGTTDASVKIGDVVKSFDGYTFAGYTVKSSKDTSGSTGTGTLASFKILADGSVEVTLRYKLNESKINVKIQKKDAGKDVQAAGGIMIGLSSEGKVTASTSITTNTGGTASATYKYGSTVTLQAPALAGYTFAGWSGDYTAAGDSLRFRMPGEAVNVTALYKQITFHAGKNLTHIRAERETAAFSGQSAVTLTDGQAPEGCTYTLTLTAEEGYEMPERVTVRRDGISADSMLENGDKSGGMTYTRSADGKTGTLTIENVDRYFVVTAAGVPKQYTASFLQEQSEHVTASPAGPVSVSCGQAFVMTLTAEEGYALPGGSGGTLNITMGGTALGAKDYSYDETDGSLYLSNVTGDVTVSAVAQPGRTAYQVAYYRQKEDNTYDETPYQTTTFSEKKTGDTVDLLTGGKLAAAYEKSYTGYEFDDKAAGNQTSGVVAADGSLTLQVYYKRSEYKVSLADGSYWADGTREEKTFYYGTSVELALQEKTGYDVTWRTSTGASGVNGKVSLNMPAKDMTITPTYTPKQYTVLDTGLSHLQFSADTGKSAVYGNAYGAVLEPEAGFELPDEVSVRVAGQMLDSSRFTYDAAAGQVSLSAEAVTGTIVILASGVEKTWQVTVVLNNNTSADGADILSASKTEGAVKTGEAFQTRLTVNDRFYVLPEQTDTGDSITVTMGGTKLKAGDGYFYDRESGDIRVKDIAGDVVITASPAKAPPLADYQVAHYKENMDGTYTLTQTVRKKNGVIGERVDAADEQAGLLKSYRGFAFDKNVAGSVTAAEVKEDGSTLLKLYYKRNTCTLTLSAETGITAKAVNEETGVSETVSGGAETQIAYKYGENVVVNVSKVADGSSFIGWYQAGKLKNQSAAYRILMSEDTTLAAKSRTASYELIVEGKHAASDLPDEDYEDQIAFGEKRTVGLVPDTGYHLPEEVSMVVDGEQAAGHAYTKEADGSKGKVELTVNGNTHLIFAAQPNHYKLTLHANGGRIEAEEGGQKVEEKEIEAVYDAAYGSLPGAKRTGYTFLGWFGEKQGGEEITAGTVHLTAGDVTAYAHWKKQPVKDTGKKDDKDKTKEPEDGMPGGDDTSGGEDTSGGKGMPGGKDTSGGKGTPTGQGTPEKVGGKPGQTPGKTGSFIAVTEEKTGDDEDALKRKLPEGDGIVHVPAVMKDGKITPKDGKTWQAGRGAIHTVVFTVMDGAVSVHVNNVDEDFCRAGVPDAAEAANAVLGGEEIRRLVAGDFIEIRIDVSSYDDRISDYEKELLRDQAADMTVGMHLDVSVFMRANGEAWQELHATRSPVEIVLETPVRLIDALAEQVFYVLRIHEGELSVLADMDERPETITFRSSLFSVYAVAYTDKDSAASGADDQYDDGQAEADALSPCGICHICPTLFGICCFIWLAVITALIVLLLLLSGRQKSRDAES